MTGENEEVHRAMARNLGGKPNMSLPQPVCEALGIEVGDLAEFTVCGDTVEIRAVDDEQEP